MVDGISSSSSYRDQWANMLSSEETVGSSESTDKTEQVWNAVFTDEKDNGVTVDDFLSLMVAQLRNQDFMNPVDDTQYVTQLAQFSTMQQMQELATYMKTNYVMSLVGKNVTAAKFSVSGELLKETGAVEKISLVNNEYAIYVNGKKFTLEQIMEINSSSSTSSTDTEQKEDPAKQEYLLSLIGKEVTVWQRDADGELTGKITGVVEKVSSEDGEYRVYIDGSWYALDDIVEIGGGTKPEEDEQVPDLPEEGGEITPDPDAPQEGGEITPNPDEGTGDAGGTQPGGEETGEGGTTELPDDPSTETV